MWEFIHKILLLFIERKDKYKHAEEKLQRRVDYFKELKTIEELNLDEDEQRARRNALAQRLVGSQLVSFDLVNYLIKNKNITNFEVIVKRLALWDTSLNIEKCNEGKIFGIKLNEKEYSKEKRMIIYSLLFNVCILIYSLCVYKSNLLWFQNYLLIPDYISKFLLLTLSVLLLVLFFLLFVSAMVLFDLKRVVELINKKAP